MKRGISLIVLSITVILLVIITGVVVINSEYLVADTSVSQLTTDISQIQYLMQIYNKRKSGNIGFETATFDTSKLSDKELQQFSGENIVDNKINLYIIDLFEIDAETVNLGNQENGPADRYLYSNTTGKVYYEQGIKMDEQTYYYIESGDR